MFIVIEWIDWSWKWTQVLLLKDYLEKQGKSVKLIDYPRYGEKSCFFVEKYLNWGYWNDVNANKASLFYALDRYDSSFELTQNLKNFDYVIANRYVSSNIVHQAWKIKDKKDRNKFLKWLIKLEYEILEIPKPDKVIFLDVNPLVSSRLVEKKDKREYIIWDENKDLHEKDEKHLINAYENALKVAKKYKWKIVNCVKDWEIIEKSEITMKIIKKIL